MIQTLPSNAARLWRAHPGESLALALLGLAAAGALAGAADSTPATAGLPDPSAPAGTVASLPPPLLVRAIAPADALSLNRGIPLADGPNPAARPFSLGNADADVRARALECLTSAVYYEAGNEGRDGRRAVAQVVLNRVRHPAFPASVCGVVYQGSTRATGCQFTFTCDGSLARRPSSAGWTRARDTAQAALTGAVFAPAGNATHYHADYVVPYWASSLAKNAVVGAHIFYRWSGGWGRPAAFTQRYAQREADSAALRLAATAAEDERRRLGEQDEALAALTGADGTLLTQAGDKRVAIRFDLAAREAVEAAPKQRYVEKVEASDNLRWSLGATQPEGEVKPLGRTRIADAAAAAGGGSPN